MTIGRRDLMAVLERWRRGEMSAAEVSRWSGEAWTRDGVRFDDERNGRSLTCETLFCLDLMGVHLLTQEDVPALLALLGRAPDDDRAVDDLADLCRAIDRPLRGRRLKRNDYYRPFCG